MTWILAGLALVLLTLGLLAVLLLRLWRRVQALGRAVAAAEEVVARASDGLAAASGDGPPGATSPPPRRRATFTP